MLPVRTNSPIEEDFPTKVALDFSTVPERVRSERITLLESQNLFYLLNKQKKTLTFLFCSKLLHKNVLEYFCCLNLVHFCVIKLNISRKKE